MLLDLFHEVLGASARLFEFLTEIENTLGVFGRFVLVVKQRIAVAVIADHARARIKAE